MSKQQWISTHTHTSYAILSKYRRKTTGLLVLVLCHLENCMCHIQNDGQAFSFNSKNCWNFRISSWTMYFVLFNVLQYDIANTDSLQSAIQFFNSLLKIKWNKALNISWWFNAELWYFKRKWNFWLWSYHNFLLQIEK